MKIITPGEIPERRTYRATCRRCQCVFEFLAFEARKVHDQRDGDYFQVACPTCSSLVTKDANR